MEAPKNPAWPLNAGHLREHWQNADSFVLLDTHFCLSRFLAVCSAFAADPGTCNRLFYLTVCPLDTPAPPLRPDSRSSSEQRLLKDLIERWPLPLLGIHHIPLLAGRIHLSMAFGEADSQVRLFDATCDAFLLDGRVQVTPSALARLARTEATVALHAASQAQADSLVKAGFALAPTAIPHTFSGHFRVHKRTTPSAPARSLAGDERAALVIGAGLAGTAIAAALAARGWDVSLLERAPVAATGASGNLAAVFSPLLSLDDGKAARLSRACFLRLLQELRTLTHSSPPVLWQSCGVLQLPRSEKEEAHFRELLLKHAYPERYVRFLEKEVAQQQFGQVLPSGGWFFEEGGWVNPPSLCAARLGAHPRIRPHFGQDVHKLEHRGGRWNALGPDGKSLASAPVLILANAWEANLLLPQLLLPFKRVRGQVAHLPLGSVPALPTVLSKDGYLTPPVHGFHCLGATYDFGSNAPALTPDAHRRNLARLEQMLPHAPPTPDSFPQGRVGFRSLTPDRLPIVGALSPALFAGVPSVGSGNEEAPGLYCLLGLGSRGVVWSSLLGEHLASLIEATPSPLPLDLSAPLEPSRFGPGSKRTPLRS